jgi:hypothetical protein
MATSELQVTVHPGTEQWVPSHNALETLGRALKVAVRVEFIPRSRVREIWIRDHSRGDSFPGHYAFRAYTKDKLVRLFVDQTETRDSALWLLVHELAHVAVDSNDLLDLAYSSFPRPAAYRTDDRAHEAWPEEQLANNVADQWGQRLGYPAGLNRLWWRKRVPRS